MKKFVLFLLLAFFAFLYSANAQDPLLLEAIKYFKKGSQSYSNKSYSAAIKNYNIASEKLTQMDDKNAVGYCYQRISICYTNLKEYENALLYLNKALTIFRGTGLKWEECAIYNDFGYIHYLMEDYEKALEYYNIALEIERETENKQLEKITLGNVVALYKKLGEEKKILEFQKKYENVQLEIDTFFILYKKALELRNKKKYEESRKIFIEALELAKYIHFIKGEIYSKRRLGWVCYKLELNEDSLKYNLEALEMARGIDSRYDIAYTLQNLGYIYYEIGEVEKANKSFEESYIYAIEVDEKETQRDVKWALRRIEKGKSIW